MTRRLFWSCPSIPWRKPKDVSWNKLFVCSSRLLPIIGGNDAVLSTGGNWSKISILVWIVLRNDSYTPPPRSIVILILRITTTSRRPSSPLETKSKRGKGCNSNEKYTSSNRQYEPRKCRCSGANGWWTYLFRIVDVLLAPRACGCYLC